MTSRDLKAAATAIAVLLVVLAIIVGVGLVATPPPHQGSLQAIPSASGT